MGHPAQLRPAAAGNRRNRHRPTSGVHQLAAAARSTAHKALHTLRELGYAATADERNAVIVTGWDPALLAQRADRAQVELRALELARHDVAHAALGRLRNHLANGVSPADAAAKRHPLDLDLRTRWICSTSAGIDLHE